MRPGETLNDLATRAGFLAPRTGRHARRLARERQTLYLRRHWRLLALTALLGLAATGFTVFLPSWLRGFVAGVWVTAVAGSLVFGVAEGSGSLTQYRGEAGELWTSQELRALRRSGWVHLDHLGLRTYRDVDHVAVGPTGVVVVESKYSSSSDPLADRQRLATNVLQAKDNLKDVKGVIRHQLHGAPTRALLVYWSPSFLEKEGAPFEQDGVTVMAGRHLRAWLEALPTEGAGLDPADVAAITRKLAPYTGYADKRDLAGGRPKRTAFGVFGEGAVAAMTAIGSWMLGFGILRWVGPLWLVPVIVGMAMTGLVGLVARKDGLLRMLALGWTVGTVAFALLIGVLYGYFSLFPVR